MIRDELLRDADERLESFAEAKTVCEAEEHYRALVESLIPDLYDAAPVHAAAVEQEFRGLVERRILRAGGVRERPAALLSCRRGREGAAYRRREPRSPLP